MSKCPDCGVVENAPAPEGSLQRCGRRGYYVPSDDWKERVARQQACERAAARRGYSREQWVRESGQ
jgi:hypothetical protein